jgi:C1A family cysteine protease
MSSTCPPQPSLAKYKLNYAFETKEPREKLFRLTPFFQKNVQLPESWDIRNGLEPIKVYDQGAMGTCVAQSMGYHMQIVAAKQRTDEIKNNDIPVSFMPSRLFIYWNARKKAGLPPDEDSGVGIRSAFHAVADNSTCREELWPYDEDHIFSEPDSEACKDAETFPNFSSIRLAQDAYALKLCLFQGFAVSVGLQLYESFMSDEVAQTGKVPLPDPETEKHLGGHCVTLIGWDNNGKGDDDDTFTVLNSWGPCWGDQGACHIPVGYVLNPSLADDFHSMRKFY